MDTNSLRIGIAGAGFAAGYHFECIRRIYGIPVEIIGVTSKRPESAKAFADKRGLTPFHSYEEMLNKVDVVDICTPPSVHEEMIIKTAMAGKHVIVEKPLTGYFGPSGAGENYRVDRDSKDKMITVVKERLGKIKEAVSSSGIVFCYAENFVYAPAVQKEAEIIRKSGSQILRMIGEESHSGSHSKVYGWWRHSGGGSLIGKGCHPLTGMLYLKCVEGIATNGKPIRPKTVSARTHTLTRIDGYRDLRHIRTDYHDVEDFGWMHVTFDDGTVADVVTGEVVIGGIYDWIEIFANNHRARCRLNPNDIMDLYTPDGDYLKDVYIVEKTETKEGWSHPAPDENWSMGYQAELQFFIEAIHTGKQPESNMSLAIDTTMTIYAAYLSNERNGAEVEIPRLG